MTLGQNLTISATFAFAVFALALIAPAQTSRAADQSVRFTVFASKPITSLAFTPRIGAVPQKLVFYPTARSPHYDYRGAMPLRLSDAGLNAVVAEVSIPVDIHEALLLVSPIEPVPASGLRYRVAVLDDSAVRHASGGLVIINFSGLALGGSVGKTEVTLKDGLNPPVPVGRSAKVMLRSTVKERSYQAYADTVQLKKNERALLVLFPPFYKGSLEVQSRLLIDEPAGAPPATGAR